MRGKELFDKLSIALGRRGDQSVNDGEYLSAAVLVPLVWDHGELAVLFEKRSPYLSWQPGEICFPGGRIERADDGPIFAAVRETMEELGIGGDQIKILGQLDEVISPIGVRLYPAIGYINDIRDINASLDEVAEVFTVPLNFLLAAEPIIGHMERCTRPLADFPFELLPGYSKSWKNRKNYRVLFYKYDQYVIWGLTAQVLHNFLAIYKRIEI